MIGQKNCKATYTVISEIDCHLRNSSLCSRRTISGEEKAQIPWFCPGFLEKAVGPSGESLLSHHFDCQFITQFHVSRLPRLRSLAQLIFLDNSALRGKRNLLSNRPDFPMTFPKMHRFQSGTPAGVSHLMHDRQARQTKNYPRRINEVS